MSLPHFFLDNQVLAQESESVFALRLSPDDLRHARVLRLKAGEHIAVIDALSDYFECEIVSASDSLPLVRIAKHKAVLSNTPQVVLVQGISKGNKIDRVIQQGTELGVSAFIPLVCERTIVKLDANKAQTRTRRWRAVAKSAAMQSGQCVIPEVSEPLSIDEVCVQLGGATAVLVFWEEADGTTTIAQALARGMEQCAVFSSCDVRVAVIIGPEGGFSRREVDKFLAINTRSALISLGSSILRTETAGVVAPSLVLYELGELGARGAHTTREAQR